MCCLAALQKRCLLKFNSLIEVSEWRRVWKEKERRRHVLDYHEPSLSLCLPQIGVHAYDMSPA